MARKPPHTPEQDRFVRERMPEWMVHPAYDSATVTFDRIAINHGIVCIACKACGKRSVLTKEACPHIRPGNMARLRSAIYRCGRHGCASTEVDIYAGCDREEAEMFLAGDPLEERYFIPEKASWEK